MIKDKEYKGLALNFISTWSPRRCGIGSFTQDTVGALALREEDVKVIKIHPIDKDNLGYIFPITEKHIIRQMDTSSWANAAEIIIARNHKQWSENGLRSITILEHEYGLDGDGEDNNFNLIARRLKEERLPSVAVLHTLLQNPNDHQKRVIQELGENCSKLIIITPTAKDILKDKYNINTEKIEYIPHGIPLENRDISREDMKQKFDLGGKVVISTPGFVSPGKGLEYGILGFSEFLKKVSPDFRKNVVYVIAGQTHPDELAKNDGEDYYRRKLEKIVEENKLEENVIFMDEHLGDRKLYDFIRASDVGIIPYTNPDQISSGILSYFVGIGTPCVSTNFIYARDLFSDGKGMPFHIDDLVNSNDDNFKSEVSGVLVNFNDPDSIAKGSRYVFENYHTTESNEYGKGVRMGWPVVAANMVSLFVTLIKDKKTNVCRIPFID
ncbi:MAG: glycosyltransferase [Candidatus Nanoarchaeia archaeon]|nr:glycosyltransferase [Candidatus Nanoarchaeia archaeon]MDD5741258.1 glycosyltransferase [Candidatus Nanoarchaeia archaeon]